MTDDTAKKDVPRRSRMQRVRRAGMWSLVLVLLLAAGVGGGAVWMKGRTILAPDWLRARIENRLTEVLPDLQIDLGAMELVVDEGWRPRARVRNVVVKSTDGTEIVALSEVKASVAVRPLLKGKLETKNIDLTGVFATLQRDVDGAVALSGGRGVASPAQKAGSLTQLIDRLDGVLQKPGVSSLTRLSIRALTLRYEDARSGRAWTIDGGRLQVLRTGDDLKMTADLSVLSGGAGVATLDANYETRIGSSQSDFGINIAGVQAGDIAAQGAAFAWLAPLRATISGSLRGGVAASGGLLPLSATLQIGTGTIQPTHKTAPIPFESARSYFTYIPSTGELRFDELSVRSDWVSGRAEGLVALQGVADGNLRDLVGQLQLSNLQINPYDLYAEPAAIAVAEMDFQLKLDPFELTLGRLQLSDQGQTILANAKVSADAEGWNVAADARMNAITPDRLTALWPKSLVPKTRKWIATNFLSGNLRNIDVAFRQTSGAKPDTYLGFEYDAAEVRVLKTMPLLRDAAGQASLFGKRFVATVEKGGVLAPQGGLVDVSGSSFIIPDVTVKGGAPAVTRLTTRSTITAALSLLNQPPMTVMDKAKLPVTLADGQVELRGTLSYPLKKGGGPDSVRYDVEGTLTNLKSDTLIKDRVLAANQMAVIASNDAVRIGGQGQLDAVDFDAEWTQQIGPEHAGKSTVRGTLELSKRTLDTFKIALPPGSVSGRGDGTFNLDLIRDAPAKFTMTSDLRGIRVAVSPVGWVKPAQKSGQLLVSGTLGPVPVVSELQMSGPGLSATGAVSLKRNGTLDRVTIDRLKVGQWLDVPVDLVGRGAGKTPAVVVKGGMLDLRAASFGGSNSGSAGSKTPIDLTLDRLQVTDTIAITDMKGGFQTGAGLDGKFTGRVNKGAAISGQVVPKNGRSAVLIRASDAGAVVASTGILNQARGGDLTLTLNPVGTGDAFDGILDVKGTSVQDAPAMAALLNALSGVGLLNELNGDGIYFTQVDAAFRLSPNRITITQASAVGPSMGLSMDGVYVADRNVLDMQGVISPIYLLNGIGSIFTRKGEGLIGFNYRLSGPAKSPNVSVNPLSALTPAMFRNLFRAPAPDAPVVEGEIPKPKKPPKRRVVVSGSDR